MPRSVPAGSVDLVVEEQGPATGSAVLLIHGMASDHLGMAPLAHALAADGLRAIAYSRRGYGGSTTPEPYTGTTVHEQAEDAARLAEALGVGETLAVGDGFGALIALDLLQRHGALVRGAVLSNPPVFALVPDATRSLADQRVELEAALRDGGPQAGVAAFLDGRADDAALARAQAAHRGFFADYAGLASLPLSRRELRALDAPVAIVTDPLSQPDVIAAADALAALLPRSVRSGDGDLRAAVSALRA